MHQVRLLLSTILVALVAWWLWPVPEPDWAHLSDQQWQQRLSAEQYHILREGGTEPPGTGLYAKPGQPGTFRCAGCGQPLFASQKQYDSGTGWPSFTQPLEGAVDHHQDNTFMFAQVEVRCGRCLGHLGHVFPDGPKPTGTRYCINSLALELE